MTRAAKASGGPYEARNEFVIPGGDGGVGAAADAPRAVGELRDLVRHDDGLEGQLRELARVERRRRAQQPALADGLPSPRER